MAMVLMYGGIYGVIGLVALVIFALVKFLNIHKNRTINEEVEASSVITNEHDIVVNCTKEMKESVETVIYIYKEMLEGLVKEERKKLLKLYKIADEFHGRSKRRRAYEVLPTIQQLDSNALNTAQYYVQVVDYFYEISISLRHMTKSSYDFIDNNHEGFSNDQVEDLRLLGNEFLSVYEDFVQMIEKGDYSGLEGIKERRGLILDLYSELVKKQIKRTKEKISGTRNSILYLNILNETKVIAMKSANLMRAQMNLYNSEDLNP
jgi:Na+/phosphate symporter